MLGNEPNQGRVISKNHSMKCKLGTVRVWTGEAEESRPGRGRGRGRREENPRPRGRPITYVPVCVGECVSMCFEIEASGCSGLGAVLCSTGSVVGPGAIWPAQACPQPAPSHAADMTGPSCLVWSR